MFVSLWKISVVALKCIYDDFWVQACSRALLDGLLVGSMGCQRHGQEPQVTGGLLRPPSPPAHGTADARRTASRWWPVQPHTQADPLGGAAAWHVAAPFASRFCTAHGRGPVFGGGRKAHCMPAGALFTGVHCATAALSPPLRQDQPCDPPAALPAASRHAHAVSGRHATQAHWLAQHRQSLGGTQVERPAAPPVRRQRGLSAKLRRKPEESTGQCRARALALAHGMQVLQSRAALCSEDLTWGHSWAQLPGLWGSAASERGRLHAGSLECGGTAPPHSWPGLVRGDAWCLLRGCRGAAGQCQRSCPLGAFGDRSKCKVLQGERRGAVVHPLRQAAAFLLQGGGPTSRSGFGWQLWSVFWNHRTMTSRQCCWQHAPKLARCKPCSRHALH